MLLQGNSLFFQILNVCRLGCYTFVPAARSFHAEQSGAAEACWAHNPEVDGSKPSSANCLLSGLVVLWKINRCQTDVSSDCNIQHVAFAVDSGRQSLYCILYFQTGSFLCWQALHASFDSDSGNQQSLLLPCFLVIPLKV